MRIVTIPDPIQPFMSLKVDLEGTNYRLGLSWNMRSGWYVSISAEDGTVLLGARKLVTNFPLLEGMTDEARPRGEMILLDSASPAERPGYEDLGRRHILFYIEEGEEL